ncbi:phosphoglycerate mutase-like protein [Daldinia sp. FL1419]|nr:phosphoglycerate mutase-like protein [Daldinia sp. FL1419]
MRILLIRHGESVDNVAGLYAGSRDSPLTSHGVLQTKRLGAYLAQSCDPVAPIKHIFTSNLRRAYETADAISKALVDIRNSDAHARLEVVQLPELRKKDYGSSEGKKYRNANNLVQPDSETRESMRIRVNRFLDSHMTPIVDTQVSEEITIAIVAHGIILGVLLKALLERFPRPASSTKQSRSPGISLESASWSNTGILQAKLELANGVLKSDRPVEAASSTSAPVAEESSDSHKRLMCLTVEFTNNIDHLEGLKKTKGGIGSAKFDSRQRTMDSFFGPSSKKRKIQDS